MDKAFNNFLWKNDRTTPLNATNLNKLNDALNTIDNRVIALQEVTLVQNNVALSTSQPTSVTFNNSAITTDKPVDVYTSVDGLDYQSLSITNGQCVITYPKQNVSTTINVKIYIRN